MKTTMKKVLSMTLALVLLLGVLPMTALATDTPTHTWKQEAEKHTCSVEGCAEHTSGAHSDGNNNGICDICDYLMSENHTCAGGTATCSAKAVCVACDQPYGETLPHTGGTATCKERAVCTVCTQPYGELSAEHTYSSTTWQSNDATHWHTCVCGSSKADEAVHTWTNGVCSICEKSAGNVTVLVKVNESGANTHKDGGSFAIPAGTTMTVSSIRDAYHASSAAQYVPAKIQSYCITANGQTRYPGDSVDVVPTGEYILWLEVPAAEAPSQGGQTGGNTGNGTTGGTTTEKYTVYYNVNVNNPASTWLYDYEHGTSMSTVLADLNKKTITYPGSGTPDWFYIEGWYKDKACTQKVDPASTVTENTTLYAKWLQKQRYAVTVWLCTNGNFSNAVPVDAFYFAQDGWITQSEVENIANNKFKAGNSAGLTIYGPFDAAGWENYRYYNNRLNASKQIQIDTTKENNIYAMVHNVEIYSSSSTSGSKADSTNPKTGDMIMMPAAVLGLSASALAVMFYLKKKRAY